MDLLRSCYRTEMAFFRDNDTAIKVQWFFSDAAPFFPAHTLFGSGNWASDRFDWPGPGEVLGSPRLWVDGSPPSDLMDGHKFCGAVADYAEGSAYPGVALNGLPDGRCECCTPFPPDCADVLAPLPVTLRLRITAIRLLPPDANPSNFHVGEEFDLNEVLPPPGDFRVWISPALLTRDGCPVLCTLGLRCGTYLGTVQVVAVKSVDLLEIGANGLVTDPFVGTWLNYQVSLEECFLIGYGQEFWDFLIFDPAHPPP